MSMETHKRCGLSTAREGFLHPQFRTEGRKRHNDRRPEFSLHVGSETPQQKQPWEGDKYSQLKVGRLFRRVRQEGC